MRPGYNLDVLKLLDPEWKSRTVDTVTFPAPPVLAKGVMYAEDCWASSTLERGEGIFRTRGRQCLGSVFTNRGPAFLVRYSLEDLFEEDRRDDRRMIIPESIYCATISFSTLLESPKVLYANNAILEGVMSIGHSCHPGSHTAVPRAPWLTLILELERAESSRVKDFVFADHDVSERYFPTHDFSSNDNLDQLFRYATIQDLLEPDYNTDQQTQVLIQPTLSARLVMDMIPRLESNERVRSTTADIHRFVHAVDVRDRHLQGD